MLVLAKEVVAAAVPSRDVVSVEAVWDVLLRCAEACCNTLCMWRPHRQLVDLGDLHGVLLSVSAVNNSQLAFRKFHLLTGLPAIGLTSDGTLMIDGRRCDRGNLLMMRRSGLGSQLRPTTNARSGLVYVQRSLGAPLGHTVAMFRHPSAAVTVTEQAVRPATSIRNLGVVYDQPLSMI